ncbi:hypothetical protein AAFC00_004655 [Neodothiora populina]|uniref:Ubiquitin ligase complex F-box protein GRR1 n=1 Tax=Neodothiora populina TaxID=2781224 RepID=A0ABR3P2Y2_9PEZI
MSRARRQHRMSDASNSSSSSTSPERGVDDDNDSFMMQANDSASSLAPSVPPEEMSNAEYEERCRVSPVYRLPAELLIAIFSRLSSTTDLRSCTLVSKEWARNSVGLLWHRPQTNNWRAVQSVARSIVKADKFFAYQDLVKRLNLSTLASQVSDGTLHGFLSCKRIERLTLTNCTKLHDESLMPLIKGNKSLIALDVTGLSELTDETLMVVADNCLRLQGLNITGCRNLTDASLIAVAKNCRHLKRLKCNSCAQITDNAITTVADNSTHLLEIDLYDLPLLESTSITALMTSCPALRELRLARCPGITDFAFLSIPAKTPLFDALRILDLTDCSELGDKAIEKIVSLCPRLRNLILAKCRQLTDRAVWAITRLGKNLHYIHLGHCARITDASIVALAKACNRIRYIDLACCSNLTDVSITQLANLPKLKRVGLVKCAGITDRSIQALATYGGRIMSRPKERSHGVSALERVHLSYCTQLTLDGIHTLLNNCPRLTHLSLTGVQAFLRDDLTVFCREAPSEFNDHQREVFCVFSGTGVARLREYLNGGGTDAALETGIVDSDDEDGEVPVPPTHRQMAGTNLTHWPHVDHDGVDDEEMEDEEMPVDAQGDERMGLVGQGSPEAFLDVRVHSTPGNDNALAMTTPHGLGLLPNMLPQQRAPTRTQSWTGMGGVMWAHASNYAGSHPMSRTATPPQQGPSGAGSVQRNGIGNVDASGASYPAAREAQHVTGMMGAVNMMDSDETR